MVALLHVVDSKQREYVQGQARMTPQEHAPRDLLPLTKPQLPSTHPDITVNHVSSQG